MVPPPEGVCQVVREGGWASGQFCSMLCNTRHTISVIPRPHSSHMCFPSAPSRQLRHVGIPPSVPTIHTPAWACLPHSPQTYSHSRFRQWQIGITIFIIGNLANFASFGEWAFGGRGGRPT